MLDCAIIMKALNHSHNYFLPSSINGIRDKSDPIVELFKIISCYRLLSSSCITIHYCYAKYLIVTNYKLLCKENLFRHYVMLRIDNHHVSVITLWQHKKYFLISNTISLPKMSEFCRLIIA